MFSSSGGGLAAVFRWGRCRPPTALNISSPTGPDLGCHTQLTTPNYVIVPERRAASCVSVMNADSAKEAESES